MIHEAQLFTMAQQVLAEVLTRIRPQDFEIVLPAVHGRAQRPERLADVVARQQRDDAELARILSGAPAGVDDAGAVPGPVPAVHEAAGQVTDGSRVVDGGAGPVPVGDLLVQATVERALLAHYVAAYLGSTACPLPEELARPLWERTAPDAAAWRARGDFRVPLPLPDHVSWRDRFMLDAGHEPHPLGH